MQLPTVRGPWSFYRLGPTSEKDLFKRRRETYDGVVVPAHIASYYAAFCAEFIGSLQKPYFIDPITYIFAGDPKLIKRFVKDKVTHKTVRDSGGKKRKGDIKRSYIKLVDQHYRGIVKDAVAGDRPLRVSDFSDELSSSEFVNLVIGFQREQLSAVPDKYKKYEKYAQQAGKTISFSANPPMFLVPPYFLIDDLGAQSWHSVNLDLARRSRSVVADLPLFGVILTSIERLHKNAEQIVSDYAGVGLDGFLIWVDGLTGYQDLPSLSVVRNFVARLSGLGKPVISMYGDAFSLALSYFGLTGYCCGICYGERKESGQDVDVEGIIPPRYYVERLKKKIRIETEARRISLNAYPDLVCDCQICLRKPDPGDLVDVESREHFMLVRAREVAAIRQGLPKSEFSAALTSAYKRYKNEPLLQPISHLRNWATLLSEEPRSDR